ncbi:MAG: hypothetical protein VB124_05030 [Burkholderia sp.]
MNVNPIPYGWAIAETDHEDSPRTPDGAATVSADHADSETNRAPKGWESVDTSV